MKSEIKGLYKKNGICYDSGKEITVAEYEDRIAAAEELCEKIQAAKEDLEEIDKALNTLDGLVYALTAEENSIQWKSSVLAKLTEAYGQTRAAKWELAEIIKGLEMEAGNA